MNIENLGSELAKETDLSADFVVPVPDSGVPPHLGMLNNLRNYLS